jgi:tetratricopeptide (TPR) repeat protein
LAKLEAGKKEATVLYNAGRKLLQSKRYAEAAQKFEQAVERRPDAVGSYISLGNCYLRLGQNDRALAAFQSAVKNDPSYGPSHYNLAAYFAVTGDNQRALASLGKALKLDSAIRSIVKADPDFARLRNTPEFTRLLER